MFNNSVEQPIKDNPFIENLSKLISPLSFQTYCAEFNVKLKIALREKSTDRRISSCPGKKGRLPTNRHKGSFGMTETLHHWIVEMAGQL